MPKSLPKKPSLEPSASTSALPAREPAAAYGVDPAITRPLTIDVPLPRGRDEGAALKRVLEAIAPFVADATAERQDRTFRDVVDRIIESTPIRPLDARRAALEQRAIVALLAGTEWLTAEQIGRLRDPQARNPHGTVHRWRTEGKVFAVSKGGVQWFPRYAFDESLDPHPAVAQVITLLGGHSGYRWAAWFDSTNGHLGGRRPRDVLADDPDAVVAAAREHARGPVHG